MQVTKELIAENPKLLAAALGKLVIEGHFKNISEIKKETEEQKSVFGLCMALGCMVFTIAPKNTHMERCGMCGNESIYSVDVVLDMYAEHKDNIPIEITIAEELQ